MAETTITDKYVGEIRRFTLPPESVKTTEAPKAPETPPAAPAAPPVEAKTPPATEAVAPETPKEEPEKATTEKDPEPVLTQRQLDRRIAKINKRAAEAIARAEERERELAELKARAQPVVDPTEPKMADYTDIGDYGKAMREWGEKKALKEAESRQKEDRAKQFNTRLTAEWENKAFRGDAKYDDWDEVVGQLKPTSAWSIAIMQEENGEEIAYYLGKHDKEAQRIVGLDQYAQVREIAKLGVKLSAKPEAPKPAPSKAPAPIAPLSGSAAVTSDEIKPQMPFEEYKRIMDKRMGRAK